LGWLEYDCMKKISAIFCGVLFGTGSVTATVSDTGLRLVDVGIQAPKRPRVVVVDTPGVARASFLFWEQSLEEAGFDAWRLEFSAEVDRPERLMAAVRELDELWADQAYSVVAHGYGARWVVDADLHAEKMILVGAPLGPQLVPTLASVSSLPIQDGLPWPGELLGPLEQEPLALSLAQAYLDFGTGLSALDPSAPVMIFASGRDVVGPPECNRLPSQNWSDREFFRLDSFSFQEASHGELLRDPVLLRKIIRSLRIQ
jgi:hypothetical protein